MLNLRIILAPQRLRMAGWMGAGICSVAFGVHSIDAQARARALSPLTKSERWLKSVPVSGGLRVGVMAIARQKRPRGDTLYVILPSTGRLSRLCVEISSRDGRYEAKLEYDISERSPGLDTLEFLPAHRREIEKLEADELAILAHVDSTCAGKVETFVVAAWEPIAAADTVTVFLNSRVPTYVIALEAKRVTHETRCEDLSETTTAFNLRCRVPSSWMKSTGDFYVRKRERRGTRTSFVDTPLPLRQ